MARKVLVGWRGWKEWPYSTLAADGGPLAWNLVSPVTYLHQDLSSVRTQMTVVPLHWSSDGRPRASPMQYLAPREHSKLAAYLVLSSPSLSSASSPSSPESTSSLFWPSLITGLYVCVWERRKSCFCLHTVLFIPYVTYGLSSKHLAGNRTGIKTVFCPLGPGNPAKRTNGLGAPEFCQGPCL